MPQIWPIGSGELDCFAGRPPQKTLRDCQQICETDVLLRERAAPREGEKLLRDFGGVLGGGLCVAEQLSQLCRRQFGDTVESLVNQFQISRDDHQQIVEIMCDPTGQLTDQIELLGVPECRLRLSPLGDLVGEAPVGLGELVRSFVDNCSRSRLMRQASCSVSRVRSSACTVAINSSGSIGSTR
jgi:hypothetical protein